MSKNPNGYWKLFRNAAGIDKTDVHIATYATRKKAEKHMRKKARALDLAHRDFEIVRVEYE